MALNCFVMYRYLPDFVSGDFDSVDPDLLNFYKEKVGYDIAVNDQPVSQKMISYTVHQSINRSINRSISQSTIQSVIQLVN